jgi:glycosyltransferase involved in cell wall biosynthesis
VSSQPAASVIIPTRNRGDLITETIDSLLKLQGVDFEVVVVDQSTDERTANAVTAAAAGDPRVRIVRTKTVGSSAARNLGAVNAAADVVAYTDDDCLVDPDWLAVLLAEFADSRVVAVYGRLLPWGFTARDGTEVGFKAAGIRAEYSRRTPPWYIGHGGNMCFRRHALLAAGGFDLLLGAGGHFGACEDPDIAYRLLARGETVVYSGSALAYHKHWKDWRAQRRMERAYGVGAGAQFAKYIRSGDAYGVRLFATWTWELGVRRVGAGLLKWHSLKPMYLGYCQLVYPWVGVLRSLGRRVDPNLMLYELAEADGDAA